MKCPECGNQNPSHAAECEYCGFELAARSADRKTRLDAGPPPSGRRRTVFEPGKPAVQPPSRASRTYADDPFASPPPARPPYDPEDPFRTAMRPPAQQPAVQPAAHAAPAHAPQPGPAQAPPRAPAVRSATIIDRPKATAGRPAAVLVAYRGPDDGGRPYVLHPGRNTIGRDPAQDVCLEDGRVSSQHGFLFVRPDGASFIDVSTNGSLVDGRAVVGREANLEQGSVMQLGGTLLVFTPLAPLPEDAWSRS